MIKVILVDDEAKSRSTLKSLLTENCHGLIIADEADSVEAAVAAINKHDPQVVFLDIEMPKANGFELFKAIKNPGFEVVFVTAYDQYAIRAIRYSALDYLLKPIEVEELVAAVERIKEKLRQKNRLAPSIELLLANLNSKGSAARIAVPTFDGLQMIDTKDIVKCTADESYTLITIANGPRLIVSRILKEFDDLLSDLNFFRVHNSCLINLAHVNKYVKGDGGYVVMSDGEQVEVSRRKKNELLKRLSLLRS
jgi:two-component system LytT family response regulator